MLKRFDDFTGERIDHGSGSAWFQLLTNARTPSFAVAAESEDLDWILNEAKKQILNEGSDAQIKRFGPWPYRDPRLS